MPADIDRQSYGFDGFMLAHGLLCIACQARQVTYGY